MSCQQCSRLMLLQGCNKPTRTSSSMKVKLSLPSITTTTDVWYPEVALRPPTSLVSTSPNTLRSFSSTPGLSSVAGTFKIASGRGYGYGHEHSSYGPLPSPPSLLGVWGSSAVAALVLLSSSTLYDNHDTSATRLGQSSLSSSFLTDNRKNRCVVSMEGVEGGTVSDFPSMAASLVHQATEATAKAAASVTTTSIITTTAATPTTSKKVKKNVNRQVLAVAPTSNYGWKQPYDISVGALQGERMAMEDEYIVAQGGRFVAVFDGHGGGDVSKYLKHHLYQSMERYLRLKHWEESELLHAHHEERQPHNHVLAMSHNYGEEQSVDETDFVPSISCQVAALRNAFAEMENDVMSNERLSSQGSTAVAVVIHENKDGHKTILSANVGDSRAILSRKRKAIDLTRDHKPSDEREKERIFNAGGRVEWDREAYVHRVNGLSLSRAIGDDFAKPIVTSDVEIAHFPITESSVDQDNDGDNDNDDQFILLASDGLWDVMRSDEVVQFVHESLDAEVAAWKQQFLQHDAGTHSSGSSNSRNDSMDELTVLENQKKVLRKAMAKKVAQEAIGRGSGDNVCVVMVWLKDLKCDGSKTSVSSLTGTG